MAAVFESNLTIQKGANFEETFTLSGEDGIPINLVGSFATCKLKKHPTAGIAYTFSTLSTVATGTIKISMTPEVTSTLPSGRCYYDLFITYPNDNLVSKVVQGTAIVIESVSL